MRFFERPVAYYHENRFIITEDGAWFVPYGRELDWPPIADILAAIFDLDDPEVVEDLDRTFLEGRMIFGYYYPKTNSIKIDFPEVWGGYVERRIEEVFRDA